MANPVTLDTITFSEQPLGTADPVYNFPGILSGKNFRVDCTGVIVKDTDNPSWPSIAADDSFIGPVVFDFSAPVSAVSLEAGFFDLPNTTRVIIEGLNGFRIEVEPNAGGALDYESFSFDYGENVITRVRIESMGQEPAGFAVDNLSVTIRPESHQAALSGDQGIDSLIGGTAWNGKTVTWSFIKANSHLPGYGDTPETFAGSANLRATAAPLSDGQKAMTQMALGMFDGVAAISFQQLNGGAATPGMMRFGMADIADPVMGFRPGDFAHHGDVWLDTSQPAGQAAPGSLDYLLLMREVGRSLGLKEPDSGSGSGVTLPAGKDSLEFSVMSNRSFAGADTAGFTNAADSFPQSLMMNDIAALQHLYGADFKFNGGNTVYSFDPAEARIFETVWDGGGIDTYDASAYSTNVTIDLTPGKWSVLDVDQLADLKPGGTKAVLARGNVFNAELYHGDVRSLIENASGGSGNDVLGGNDGANLLRGNGGRDQLDGRGGRDVLRGDAGNDQLVGGSGADKLRGGTQQDQLTGSGGRDKFIFDVIADSRVGEAAHDTIADFQRGSDRIDLHAMDANSVEAGRQAWTFAGLTEVLLIGQLGYQPLTNGVLLQGENNGDREPDFEIFIATSGPLTESDFILT